MIKLYKKIDGILNYWECWDNEGNKSAMIHWGVVGNEGQSKVIKSGIFSKFRDKIQSEIDHLISEGYKEIPFEEHCTLLIEYEVYGMGNKQDVEKRHALEDRMQETLGWTGLGNCDGGSIGSGTMEICCFVVDFEIAKKAIESDLKGTEFEDYTRIYDEGS